MKVVVSTDSFSSVLIQSGNGVNSHLIPDFQGHPNFHTVLEALRSQVCYC